MKNNKDNFTLYLVDHQYEFFYNYIKIVLIFIYHMKIRYLYHISN